MKNNRLMVTVLCATSFLAMASVVRAQEMVVDSDKRVSVDLSIYNNNLALVKDVRRVELKQGDNVIALEGVAREIRPETVQIKADGIVVMEQNYEYNVLNYANMLKETEGQVVKTAVLNPQNGQMIFNKAKLVSSEYGQPILEFDYGVEANFPGRVVYDKLPNNLRQKPTMVATVKSDIQGQNQMEMLYLTSGLSWRADYVADIKNDNTLDLSSWVTLNNNSGVDYKNATVNVISGNVNQEYFVRPEADMMVIQDAPMMAKSKRAMAGGALMAKPVAVQESVGDYYLYTIAFKTTIKDRQSKQVSLLSKDDVKFEKKYKMYSPLGISFYSRETEVKNINPETIIKLNNVKESNLGIALPYGVVRFYDKDSKGKAQFLGESRIEQLAVGGEAELRIGTSFDIFTKAKLSNIKKLSEDIVDSESVIEFNNATDKEVKVEFLQGFGNDWQIISESIKSEKENANTAKWVVIVPANAKTELKYSVRINKK